MAVTLMDCTLRDGANVVGKGFSADLTRLMLEGLVAAGVPIIELGNAGGIGAYEVAGFTQAETDETYLELAKPYLSKAQLGMFLNAKRYRAQCLDAAQTGGLHFLRCGADAGECEIALEPVRAIKAHGMKAYYSAMKAYLLPPQELAEEARRLADAGLDMFTVMDSAGAMQPDEVARYIEALTKAVEIPIAFHGHNNLGLAVANALAAWRSGASVLDCGLMGMARSAGNAPTEVCLALLQKQGELTQIDLFALLDCVQRLEDEMRTRYGHSCPIAPFDLVLGLSGAHSSFGKLFRTVAAEQGVSLYRLILEVSRQNRKNPDEALMRATAIKMKQSA